MKDAKGHGSNPRGTVPGYAGRDVMGRTYSQAVRDHDRFPAQNPNMPDPEKYKSAVHQSGVQSVPVNGITSRFSGYPAGGFHALHPQTGEILKAANAKYGDLAPRFKTSEAADAFSRKRTGIK